MKKVFKWVGIVLGVLVLLVVLVAAGVFAMSSTTISKTYAVAPRSVRIPADSAALSYGAHVAVIKGCTECHGADLSGQMIMDAPPMGRFAASNLTSGKGGVGGKYTDEDWVRAIRHGVASDGRGLLIMPSEEYYFLSDEDLGALIAFIKSTPPVEKEWPNREFGPVARALMVAGQLPVPAEMLDHNAARPEAPTPGVTVAYGGYLATVCVGCHGANFSGGPAASGPPGGPEAANLTAHETGVGSWTEAQFMQMLRTGIGPDGRAIDNTFMPWRPIGKMTDDELKALWRFFQSLPPTPKGQR